MADCLSSSIFSLWPKRNSSSKCTNYKILSLYTPLKFYRLPQRQLHTQTHTHTHSFVRSYMYTAMESDSVLRTRHWFQCLRLLHTHVCTHPVQIWNSAIEWVAEQYIGLFHSLYSVDEHLKLTHIQNWTANCVSSEQCQFRLCRCKCEPFGFGVGIYCVVHVFVKSFKPECTVYEKSGATRQSRRANEMKNSSHTRRVTWWNSNKCQPTMLLFIHFFLSKCK